MTTARLILTAATVLTGLYAGLFTAFSYAVMPGLRRADDGSFVQAMRGINVAILNPVFALIFGGAIVAGVTALVLGWSDASRPWVVTGIVLYVGVIGVTAAVNVPLNDALEAGTGSAAELRAAFEDRWVLANHLRSALSTGAFAALLLGLLLS